MGLLGKKNDPPWRDFARVSALSYEAKNPLLK
jgi:hypothetical protein